jgi:glycosyltransferase involved in cell wall biosynthesis
MTAKIRVLFKGWFQIPHSYSMVNCFQIVHLYKNYSDKVEFYVNEMPYYRDSWNSVKKLVYSEEYNNIIRNFKQWNGEDVDIVYSITYPYNISTEIINGKNIPKCVFYTSEFTTLDENYFVNNTPLVNDAMIIDYIKTNNNLYMTSPSVWSSLGMEKYNLPSNKNRIITHGVDSSVFYYNPGSRNNIRKFYGINENDIFMINIGAMTKNKGMVLILQSLNILVNVLGKKEYKILLKGTGDLYQSKTFLEIYFEELQNANAITKSEMNNLLSNHIIFTDKTLSYSKINDLFNAADLYISPYLAEGFNLTSLESLASGLPVLIPRTGSTKEYINDIYNNGGEKFIHYLDSEVVNIGNGMKQNNITLQTIINTLVNNEPKLRELQKLRNQNENDNSYLKMKDYIETNYSWNKVSELLFEYFKYIKNNTD